MAYSYKGAITFGLVYIPITLSLSVKENNVSFNLLDKKTMSRIKYKKTCVDCDNKEVKIENIVKGYQYEKDKFVLFSDEDFEKIKSTKDKNITIEHFVKIQEVDPIFFDKSYFVLPVGSEKAFSVLLKAMEKKNMAGLAKTVLGTKETLILLRVHKGSMVASTLFFYEEIQKAPSVKEVAVQKKEIELAETLIEQMTDKFRPEKYKDEYNKKIQDAIKKKIAGKKIVSAKKQTMPKNVINIMDALQKSLKTNKKSKQTAKKSKRVA
ncbi:MAG: Ku protein [Christensenellales bacterium]